MGFPADCERTHPHLARARQTEHVQGEAKRLVYGASSVVLNLHHNGFGNMKFFEAAACGAFQISNLRSHRDAASVDVPLYEEVVAVEEGAELPACVERYLADPEERGRIADHLRERVLAEHTWEHRLDWIFEQVGLTAGARP